MVPNIYKWVGELYLLYFMLVRLAARSLSIFGDHQDIYVRQTGNYDC